MEAAPSPYPCEPAAEVVSGLIVRPGKVLAGLPVVGVELERFAPVFSSRLHASGLCMDDAEVVVGALMPRHLLGCPTQRSNCFLRSRRKPNEAGSYVVRAGRYVQKGIGATRCARGSLLRPDDHDVDTGKWIPLSASATVLVILLACAKALDAILNKKSPARAKIRTHRSRCSILPVRPQFL